MPLEGWQGLHLSSHTRYHEQSMDLEPVCEEAVVNFLEGNGPSFFLGSP